MMDIESIRQQEIAFQRIIENHQTLYISAYVIFVLGALISFFLIKKHNNYTNKESLFALTGIKKFNRTYAINIIIAAAIIIPSSIWFYIFTTAGHS